MTVTCTNFASATDTLESPIRKTVLWECHRSKMSAQYVSPVCWVGSVPRPSTRMTWGTVGSMASSWRSACSLTPAEPIRSARAASAPARLRIAEALEDFTICWTLSETLRTSSTRNYRIGLATITIPTLSPSIRSIRCCCLGRGAEAALHAVGCQHGKQIQPALRQDLGDSG